MCAKPVSIIRLYGPELTGGASKNTAHMILQVDVRMLDAKPTLTRNSSTGWSFAFQKRRSGIAMRSVSPTRSP